jgi:hypothetical protein
MAAPNIGSTASSVYLRSASSIVGTATGVSATLVVSNGSASSAVLRITRLDVNNIDGTNAADVTVLRLQGTNSTAIVSTVVVPADACLRVYDDYASCTVPEGHEIRILASAANDLTFDAEYQEFA